MRRFSSRGTVSPRSLRDPPSVLDYRVISVCDEQRSNSERVPLAVINDTTVAQLDAFQLFTARPGAT